MGHNIDWCINIIVKSLAAHMQLLVNCIQLVRFNILCIPVETKKKFQFDLCSLSFTQTS